MTRVHTAGSATSPNNPLLNRCWGGKRLFSRLVRQEVRGTRGLPNDQNVTRQLVQHSLDRTADDGPFETPAGQSAHDDHPGTVSANEHRQQVPGSSRQLVYVIRIDIEFLRQFIEFLSMLFPDSRIDFVQRNPDGLEGPGRLAANAGDSLVCMQQVDFATRPGTEVEGGRDDLTIQRGGLVVRVCRIHCGNDRRVFLNRCRLGEIERTGTYT